MTPLRLREMIVLALREHPHVTAVGPTGSLSPDVLGLDVTDTHGLVWRVHVVRTPRPGGIVGRLPYDPPAVEFDPSHAADHDLDDLDDDGGAR